MAFSAANHLPLGARAAALHAMIKAHRDFRDLSKNSASERKVKKALHQANEIPSFPNIVEIGTLIGTDAREFFDYWPDATYVGFEAAQDLARLAQINLRNQINAQVLSIAIGAKPSVANAFFRSSGAIRGSSSLLGPKEHLTSFPSIKFKEVEWIQTTPLDAVPQVQSMPVIDILWMDVQGAEQLVIEGASESLKRTRFVFTEVNYLETYHGTPLFEELVKIFDALGFRLVIEYRENAAQGNALFGRF